MATAAAAELPKLGLADALALLLLYSRTDRRRFERAAVRWHGWLCLEAGRLSPADAALALAALGALGDGQPGPSGARSRNCSRPTGSRRKPTSCAPGWPKRPRRGRRGFRPSVSVGT